MLALGVGEPVGLGLGRTLRLGNSWHREVGTALRNTEGVLLLVHLLGLENKRHGTNTDRSVECQGVRLVCAVSYS